VILGLVIWSISSIFHNCQSCLKTQNWLSDFLRTSDKGSYSQMSSFFGIERLAQHW
jgi:hypothetical protein